MSRHLGGLFQSGNFNLHSGAKSNFKIDCDLLSDEDLNAIADQLAYLLPAFSRVIGQVKAGGSLFVA